MEITLIGAAGAFAIFTGLNDGGSLLATSLKIAALRPVTAAAVLTIVAAAAPVLVGTEVATTLANRLVDFQGPDGDTALLIAVAGACAVVLTLSLRSLPTSLTLALVGAIMGVGLGGGMSVSWTWVCGVLALAAAAPFVGLGLAIGTARMWRGLPLRLTLGEQARFAHRIGLALLAGAYGVNDGQKMLAVFALAMPSASMSGGEVSWNAWMLAAIAGLFAIGLLFGFRRHGTRLGATVRTFSPIDGVTAQLSAALAVTGTAVLGAPASITQSLTGALVGCGLSGGGSRVRWQHPLSMVAAWFVTIPLAMGAAAVPASLIVGS